MSTQQPERKWYDGRAAAESAKTLAWRFAVNGDPFPRSLKMGDAVDQFTEQIVELTRDLPSLDRPSHGARQVTQAMRTLREAKMADRKRAYEAQRLVEQQEWYSGKADWNNSRAMRWGVALVAIDVFGLIAALARLVGWIELDILGIATTLAAAGVAWTQVKQHELLARSYAVASQELSAVRDQLVTVRSEEEWASAMARAENAISREHTLWRAARGVESGS